MMKSVNARTVALEALLRVEINHSYSNIILNKLLQQYHLSGQEASLASALFYGVLEKEITLDYFLDQFSKIKRKKMSAVVLTILRMGIYQILFMDKIPDSAAVNEAVNLSKQKGAVKASGFINAVLRNFIRAKDHLIWPNKENAPMEYLSVRYSCPQWLIQHFMDSYGETVSLGILESLEKHPPIYIRVNTTKITSTELQKQLEEIGVKANIFTSIPNTLLLENTGSVEENQYYQNGFFHVQDLSSQVSCMLFAPQAGETVIDVCSAPGGKSFTIAEYMNNQGEIFSFDQFENKVQLIQSGAKRLGITIIHAGVRDGRTDNLFSMQADRVLCDVPCSGLGIIRRKPEIRYKESGFLKDFPLLQYEILSNSAKLVKKDGILFYSTCTLNPSENGEVVQRFLQAHPDFEPKPLEIPEGWQRGIAEPSNQWTLFPHVNGTDGFFMAAFRRKR